MANQDQGSFLAGFSVGLFAGAAGYFLFGTDRGRQLKHRLAHEWEAARKEMPERGSGLVNYSSVTELIQAVGNTIKQAEKQGREKMESQRVTKEKRGQAKKATPKFKGV